MVDDVSYKESIKAGFKEFTSLEDDRVVVNLLEKSNWDLQHALETFFNDEKEPLLPDKHKERAWSLPSVIVGLFSFLRRLIFLPYNIAMGIVNFLFVPAIPQVTASAANSFIKLFEREYSLEHSWCGASFREAVRRSEYENKYLILFAYKKEEDLSDYFCRNYFSVPSVMSRINDEFVYWGVMHDSKEVFMLERLFHVSASSIYVIRFNKGMMNILLHINVPLDCDVFIFQLNGIGKPITVKKKEKVVDARKTKLPVESLDCNDERENTKKQRDQEFLKIRKMKAVEHNEEDLAGCFPLRVSLPSGKFYMIHCCADDKLRGLIDKMFNKISELEQPFLITAPFTGNVIYNFGSDEEVLLRDLDITGSLRLQINFIDYDME